MSTDVEAEKALMPPPPPKQPEHITVKLKPKLRPEVLEEDDYTKALGDIIQRDFFPDLPKLRYQREYLVARHHGDVIGMGEALKKRSKYLKGKGEGDGGTPMITPSLRTPGSIYHPASHTPLQGPDVDDARSEVAASVTYSDVESIDGNEEKTKNKLERDSARLSLDQFHRKYTSEDNASFGELMEKQEAETSLKNRHYFHAGTTTKALEASHEKKTQMRLAAGYLPDERATDIQTWDYNPKSALMFLPSGAAPSLREAMHIEKGNTRDSVPSNTRFRTSDVEDTPAEPKGHRWTTFGEKTGRDGVVQQLGLARDAARGAVNLDEFLGTPRATDEKPASPKVGGYGFLKSPSPAPGVDASPFMTWGELDDVVLMNAGDEHDMSTPGGKHFTMQRETSRERVASKLSASIQSKRRTQARHAAAEASKALAARTPRPGSLTPTRPSTVSSRYASLSPAARSLAKRGGLLSGGVSPLVGGGQDRQLRRAYTPSASPSRSATPTHAHAHASAHTPTRSSTHHSEGGTGGGGVRRAGATAVSQSHSHSQSQDSKRRRIISSSGGVASVDVFAARAGGSHGGGSSGSSGSGSRGRTAASYFGAGAGGTGKSSVTDGLLDI